MLRQKQMTPGGELPPRGTDSGPAVGFVAKNFAANEARFSTADTHARRMRRQRRSERSRSRSNGGWSVGMW